jgi:16S rRNA (cytosine1402-N4)-methyltransferase
MFEVYGEVTNAKTLSKLIVEKRKTAPILTISQFKQAIQEIVKGNPNKYLAKVFQALRIEVNDEIGALKDMLEQTIKLLSPEGRIAIITFHSLEDRIVKNFFKTGTIHEVEVDDVFGTRPESPLKVVTKKPIEASATELKRNTRSRSAKLRIAEHL